MKASGASVKLFEYIDRVPTLQASGLEKPVDFQGRIEFRNVTFAFPNRKNETVLKNVSFTVQPGEQVALVGPSGSKRFRTFFRRMHFFIRLRDLHCGKRGSRIHSSLNRGEEMLGVDTHRLHQSTTFIHSLLKREVGALE